MHAHIYSPRIILGRLVMACMWCGAAQSASEVQSDSTSLNNEFNLNSNPWS